MTIAVTGALLSACSTGATGEPLPASPSGTVSTTGSSTAKAQDLLRARTFKLGSVDPCQLLTKVQRVQLKADRPPKAGGTAATDPSCVFLASTGTSYGVFIDLTANASATVSAIQEKVSNTVTIDGFEVPLAINPGQSCSSFINTGDAQYLSVQANGIGQVPDVELCQLVQPATKMVIETLTALQP